MAFIGKLLGNVANRLDPKYTLEAEGRIEKFNSVMALKMRIKDLKEDNIPYVFTERW